MATLLIIWRRIALATVLLLMVPTLAAKPVTPPLEVLLETELGNIVIEVNESQAPKTSEYFLGLIDRGDYDGGSFYRAGSASSGTHVDASPQLLQGGLLYKAMTVVEQHGIKSTGVPLLEEIETTKQTGLKHLYGTVSFARDLLDSGSVIPEIFICLQAIPALDASDGGKPDDRGFPAFGKVIEGMDVVKKMAGRETAGEVNIEILKGQILTEPVNILSASRRVLQVTSP
jgi:peptidyl-prolyl cis-trans isomerase A (cyclophilin A)